MGEHFASANKTTTGWNTGKSCSWIVRLSFNVWMIATDRWWLIVSYSDRLKNVDQQTVRRRCLRAASLYCWISFICLFVYWKERRGDHLPSYCRCFFCEPFSICQSYRGNSQVHSLFCVCTIWALKNRERLFQTICGVHHVLFCFLSIEVW